MLVLVLKVLLGQILYWTFEAHKYILTGSFSVRYWAKKNLVHFVWNAALIALIGFSFWLEPSALKGLTELFGLNVGTFESGVTSAVVVGATLSYGLHRIIKPKKETNA